MYASIHFFIYSLDSGETLCISSSDFPVVHSPHSNLPSNSSKPSDHWLQESQYPARKAGCFEAAPVSIIAFSEMMSKSSGVIARMSDMEMIPTSRFL